jgi:LAS superfamily LD-carboxypeptidase LdcB
MPHSPEVSATVEQEEHGETVVIDGQTYSIPAPWRGHSLRAPEFEYTDFRRIPETYTHEGSEIYILRSAHQPLVSMLEAAAGEGIPLRVESAYRSERYQKRIFRRMLDEGRTFADIVRYVAPPGYSEHMLGTAVDFFPSDWQFAATPAYTWLRENAHRFGFEETYSRDNPLAMPWEAWHWNFTGVGEEHRTVSELHPPGPPREPEQNKTAE